VPDATAVATPADGTALGDLLLALASEATAAGLDAESALRDAARRYRDALRAAE
jgi:XTP/dITP diphosphohydrolase